MLAITWRETQVNELKIKESKCTVDNYFSLNNCVSYSLCCQRGNGKAGTREGRPGWLTNDHGEQGAVCLCSHS